MYWIANYEGAIRAGSFVIVLLLMLLWESVVPTRDPKTTYRQLKHRTQRKITNLSLTLINTLLLRLLPAISATAAAKWSQENEFGLFNQFSLHPVAEILFIVIALDMAIYWQHRLFHLTPILWRIHKVHHSDSEFDTTTALRFHPIEIVLSMLIKMGLVAVLGASVIAVIVFEVVLNASALFNHSNASLNSRLERFLKKLIVTPDMHRIHHSQYVEETDSNFGFFISWWDKIFKSYREKPNEPQDTMRIGLREYDPDKTIYLTKALRIPLERAEQYESQ